MVWTIIIILLVLVVLGVKIIPQSRARVIERLGSYHATLQTGVHYVIPFFLQKITHQYAKYFHINKHDQCQ